MPHLHIRSRRACTLLLLFLLVNCGRPPLRVRQVDDTVIIDVATLGEYLTTINRLRILDQSSNTVVWEIGVSAGTPETQSVKLSLGSNANQPPEAVHGEFFVVYPLDTEEFVLEPGIAYEVEVWGTGRWPARAEMTLEPVNRQPSDP